MLKNIISTSAFSSLAQIIILIVEIVIARILLPEDFGVFALSLIIIELSSLASMRSLALSYAQRKITPDIYLSSIAFVSLLLSLFWVGIITLFIEKIAEILKISTLSDILPIHAIAIPIITLEYIYRMAILKKGLFFFAGLSELISVFIYAISVYALSATGHGVLSLVYAYLIRQTLKLGLIIFEAKENFSLFPGINFKSIKKIIRMSIGLTLQGGFLFLTANTDKFFVNLADGANGVGLYTRALKLLQMPLNQAARSISSVLFVEFSKNQNNNTYLKKLFTTASTLIALLFLPICTITIYHAKEIILIIYGENWLEMKSIFQIVSIGATITALSIVIGDLLKSQGIIYRELNSNFISFIFLLASGFLVYPKYGVIGISWAFVLSQTLFLALQIRTLIKTIDLDLVEYLKIYIPSIIACAVLGLTATLIESKTNEFTSLAITSIVFLIVPLILFILRKNKIAALIIYNLAGWRIEKNSSI